MQHVRRLLLSLVLMTAVSFGATLVRGTIAHAQEARPEKPAGFDHSHQIWDKILQQTVIEKRDGRETRIAYGRVDKAELTGYIKSMLATEKAQVDAMSKNQRLAYYINLYNALTVQFILTKYPDIKSIKELGGSIGFIPNPLSTPWKQKFFTLFSQKQDLDTIEHQFIRGASDYDEPRIHFAVNCASIGCPALRKGAFTADDLNAQLEASMISFLRDRERNYVDTSSGTLMVSPIFKWYAGDFEKGHRGFTSLKDTFAKYAKHLAEDPKVQAKIAAKEYDIDYTSYDWNLNDAR